MAFLLQTKIEFGPLQIFSARSHDPLCPPLNKSPGVKNP